MAHNEDSVFHITELLVGQITETSQPELDGYTPSVSGFKIRLGNVVDLKHQAEASPLPIPVPQFLKTHIADVISYINDDSNNLEETFATATDAWLDMRMAITSPSPREIALAKLA